jgi:hypothetical protein
VGPPLKLLFSIYFDYSDTVFRLRAFAKAGGGHDVCKSLSRWATTAGRLAHWARGR